MPGSKVEYWSLRNRLERAVDVHLATGAGSALLRSCSAPLFLLVLPKQVVLAGSERSEPSQKDQSFGAVF